MVEKISEDFNSYQEHLAHEIHMVLRERELLLPKFNGSSPQLCQRRCLVDWLAVISDKLCLTHGILHLAIRYLDIVMDKFEFSKKCQANLLALCCLWVAAKLDEKDNLIPRVSALKMFLENSYYEEDFLQMELIIMQSLDWRLALPTTVQFLDYYLKDIISDDDLHVGFKINAPEKAKVYVKKYACYFLEVSLQDHCFYEYNPSHITASAVAASRLCLKITPTWPIKIITLTGYAYTELESCIECLMKIHNEDESRCKQPES